VNEWPSRAAAFSPSTDLSTQYGAAVLLGNGLLLFVRPGFVRVRPLRRVQPLRLVLRRSLHCLLLQQRVERLVRVQRLAVSCFKLACIVQVLCGFDHFQRNTVLLMCCHCVRPSLLLGSVLCRLFVLTRVAESKVNKRNINKVWLGCQQFCCNYRSMEIVVHSKNSLFQ